MKTHLPCPECGSSDALTDYGDHMYCFSCSKRFGGATDTGPPGGTLLNPLSLKFQRLARGISQQTCRRFSYGCTAELHVAPYFSKGKLLYQKTRDREKNFRVLKAETPDKELKHILFGQNVWGDLGGQRLLIAEGELDTLSAHEALGNLGFHSVGIPCGASGALESLRYNLEWISRYAEVFIGFDNDDAGRKATEEVLQILGTPKWYRLNIPPEIKDINQLLTERGSSGVLESYQTAQVWKPRGIIDPKDYLQVALDVPKRGISWPWPSLNDTTYGIRPGLTLLAAGSGVGKTTWFKQVEAHTLTQRHKIGVIHLEESASATINGLLSLLSGLPMHIPGDLVPLEKRTELIQRLSTDNKLILYDKTIGFDEELILNTIRYMRQGLEAEVVFLDHLTAIVDQYDRDVTQRTRNLIVKIGKLVTALELPLLCVSHLRKADGTPHEEGGRVHLDDLLGSGAIKQWAEHVFALERNSQTEDPQKRNLSVLRDLKNRPLGEHTGTTFTLEYNPKTFMLEETRNHGNKKSKSSRVISSGF